MVVVDVPARGPEIAVVLVVRLPVRVVVQVELELARRPGDETVLGEPFDLAAQHGTGRHRDELVRRLVDDVAQHDGGTLGPGGPPERGQVGHEVDVAVALVPAREREAGDRSHLHVDGEEVVARVCALAYGLDEEAGVEPLADQAPVMVGEGNHHGVDRRIRRQLLDRHHAPNPTRAGAERG